MATLFSLPAELRLQIWEEVLSSGSTSIMRTNRAIYTDISGLLHDKMVLHLLPGFHDPWMKVSCLRLRLSWRLNTEGDCFWKGLWDLPYGKVKLAVYLYAPDPEDMAGLVLLWQKVRCLVGILQQTAGEKTIELVFKSHNGNDWTSEIFSIPSDTSTYTSTEILSLPFHQLTSIRTSNLPAQPFLTTPTIDTIATIDFHLDTALDTLPSNQGCMLRLAHFAKWFDKPIGRPLYEDSLLRTVRKDPALIAAVDPALERLRRRYVAFEAVYLNVRGDRPVSGGWEDWLGKYPGGIPVLSDRWVREERERVFGDGSEEVELQMCTAFWSVE
ncbi:hypothetical protein BDV18DRAFT_158829 [Aspergillus unguis]